MQMSVAQMEDVWRKNTPSDDELRFSRTNGSWVGLANEPVNHGRQVSQLTQQHQLQQQHINYHYCKQAPNKSTHNRSKRKRPIISSSIMPPPSSSSSSSFLVLLSIYILIITLIFTCKFQATNAQQFFPQQQYANLSVSQSGGFRLPPQVRMDYYDNPQLNQDRRNLMYPYDARYLSDISSGKPIHDQALQFRLPFFGFSYEYIWIQRDGYISFNKGLQTYRFPLQLPIQPQDTFIQEDPSMLAPFFAMQDISSETPGAGVYFQIVNLADTLGYNDPEFGLLRDRLLLDFRDGMIGASDFVPKWAMIVTWCNMTIANRRQERPLKTNTYQAVIATDEIRTYAMFNYEQIEWITHLDNYDGLKGAAAFVGFNAGNTTRSFEFKPYSQHQRVSMLPSGGFGNNLRGRYYFQVDEEVWPGACIDKKLEPNLRDRLPLTFFPRYGHMLGGTLVDVTGPCLDPNSIIFCRFDNFKAEAVWRDTNRATCVSPPFMYHGYVDLTISVDERIEFVGRFYIQPPDVADEDVVVIDNQDREESPNMLELKWRPQKLSWRNDTSVTISLWGYRETMNVYPSLTYITTLVPSVRLGQSQFRMDLSMFRDRDDFDHQDILFGFIAINLTSPALALGARNMRQSPVIWSRPMPLAWYFRPQWLRNLGYSYKDYFCANWYERESFADRFAATVWRCPCTYQQAKVDRGRFSPDLQCNIIDRRCDTFHREALHCINTGRPSVGGSGQTCCYDDQGELIQTADTIFGGRPSRAFPYGKHPFKIRMMIPTLSTWVHDVAPYFYCCLWQKKKDNAEACQNYNYFRTSQDCSLYQAPVVGSVYGDPHMITFNKNNYTFNGKGEYVLVHADDPKVKFDVQARFEQVPKRMRNYPDIRATQLTAVAAQDNFSSIVEFRIRPLAARWRYHIYVLVDNEYIFWWDKSMQVQNFRGVTLYQPAGIQNMSHIIAMFDSGAGVEVMSIDGFMTTHVYLPADFQGITGGLLGNYSRRGQQIDDLITPTGMRFGPRTPTDRLHREFGQQWRLTEQSRLGVGKTILSHSAVRFAMYDDSRFEPVIQMPPMLPYELGHLQPELDSICSDSLSCIYDYVVSFGNKELALATKKFEAIAYEIADVASKLVVRCPALPKPANGMKSENRYWPGQVVRFSCDIGYRLVGYEARYCREDGLWSWGEDPQCISEWRYFLIMFGSIMAAFLPMAVTIAAGIFCVLFMVRRSRSHYTGEQGEMSNMNKRSYQAGTSLNGPDDNDNQGTSSRLIRRPAGDDDFDEDDADGEDDDDDDDIARGRQMDDGSDFDENVGNFAERAPRATQEDEDDDYLIDTQQPDDRVRRQPVTTTDIRRPIVIQQQPSTRPGLDRRGLMPLGGGGGAGSSSTPIGSLRAPSSSVYEATTQPNLNKFNTPTEYQPFGTRKQRRFADEPGLPTTTTMSRLTGIGGGQTTTSARNRPRGGPPEPDYGPVREARI